MFIPRSAPTERKAGLQDANTANPGPNIRLAVAFVATISLALGGCSVGPDFHPPAAPAVAHYTRNEAAPSGKPGAQQIVHGADVPGDWWTRFQSSALDARVASALHHNHDLKAAQAALEAAHQSVLAGRGSFFPSVSAGFAASRQKTPKTLAPIPNFPVVPQKFWFNLFTPQLSISYAPDLFGLNRRTQESLQAQEQAVRFRMLATWTTLTTNVVVGVVQQASLQAQMAATHKLVGLEKHSLSLLRLRLEKGDASKLDVSAQQAQLAQTEAGLPSLAKQLAAQRNALAVLVGAFPVNAPADKVKLGDLHLPGKLPLSLPSKLVAQRPDIRQARANLHAASAAVGIATAERFPDIELSANIGSTALAIADVFSSGTGFWSLAGSLTAPIFEGGRLKHQEQAAKAAYVEAAQQYRNTVLRAFEDVANTLAALHQDATALHTAAKAEQAAHTTLRLSRLRLRHGYIDSFKLLAAEQAWQQARIALIQARANRYSDSAALYQALGGGWWHHGVLRDSQ